MSLSGWWLADKVLQSAVAYGSLQCSWDTELWKDVHSIGKVLFFGLGRVYELPQLSINCRQTKKKIQIKKLPYSRFVAGWAGLSVPFIPDDRPKIPELYWAPHLGNSCVNPLIIKLYRGQRCKKGFFFFLQQIHWSFNRDAANSWCGAVLGDEDMLILLSTTVVLHFDPADDCDAWLILN